MFYKMLNINKLNSCPLVIEIQTPIQPRNFWKTDEPTGSPTPAKKVSFFSYHTEAYLHIRDAPI